jgi:hypothetical protein
MPAMKQTIDCNPYHYMCNDGADEFCRLRVYEHPGKPVVVIASRLPEFPPAEASRCPDCLADLLWNAIGRPAPGMLLIEQYTDVESGRDLLVEFALVAVRGWVNAERPKHLHRVELELLLDTEQL